MKFRKGFIPLFAFILALLPLFNLSAQTAHAATTRVAVIKSMTGTVQVKKAGGSKQFKAFTKMSLNEGDVVTTSANSTAVLQFSNGTSEDDKMSVSANTTLTFSKLSDRKGTRTKVSMFNGTAWVDVKSIASKNDEFTLETPTAVMGVRGTHLLVSVDPATGATILTVAAGVVHTQPSGNAEAQDVKPGDNALITQDEQKQGEVTIAPVDLDLLMQQNDKSIVEAIVSASGDIVKENQQKLDQYFEGQAQTGTDDLARKKSNVENLLGAIVDNAVKSGQISQDRVNQLVAEAQAQTGVTIDLSKKTLTLSEQDKRKQDEQKKKDEVAKQAADLQKKKQDEERAKNDELVKKLAADRKAQEEANRKAAEEKNKKAVQAYLSQLSEPDRQRFQDNKAKLEQTNVSTGNTGGSYTPPPAFVNPLSSLTLYYHVKGSETPETDSVTVGSSSLSYTFQQPVTSVELRPVANTSGSLVKVISGGLPANLYDGKFNVLLPEKTTVVTIQVKSPDTGEITSVSLTINRPELPGKLGWTTSDGLVWNSTFWPEHFVAKANNVDHFTITANPGYTIHLTCSSVGNPCGVNDTGVSASVYGLSSNAAYAFDLEIESDEEEFYHYDLVLVNGNPTTHNWDADAAPFELRLADGSSVSYDKSSGVYSAQVGEDVSEVSMLIDLATYDYGVDLGWNDTKWETLSWDGVDSKVHYSLPLSTGDNNFEIYISDDNLLNPHVFKLKITRTTFISSWTTTAGETADPVYWSPLTSNEFQAVVEESVSTVKMNLSFDDTKYKVLVGKGSWIPDNYGTAASMSVSSWTTSGQTNAVPVSDKGSNLYWRGVYSKDGALVSSTVLRIFKGVAAPDLFATQFKVVDGYREDNKDQPIAYVGAGNYLVHTDSNGYMELNVHFPDGYIVIGDLTITGEHLIDAHKISSNHYWIQYDKNVPLSTIKLQKTDVLGRTIIDYRLTINTADASSIGMSGLDIDYGSTSLTLAPYGPSWFFSKNSLPYEASPIDIIPSLLTGNTFEVYRDGISYENGTGIPLKQGWNTIYIVVRPSSITTGLEGAMVYELSVYRDNPIPELTSIKINGGENLFVSGTTHYSIELQPGTTLANLQFAGNISPDYWSVAIRKGAEVYYSTQSNSPDGNYSLNVIPGLNSIMINTSTGGYKEYIIDVTVTESSPPA